jgi:hypothetical protein
MTKVSNYIQSRDFKEFKSNVKKYYGIPHHFNDSVAQGDKWKEFPETKDCDHYFDYKDDTNSTGLRGPELLTDVDICYYGCSFTYGVGCPYNSAWPSIIDNHFNFKSNNFGISGIGADEMFKLFMSSSRFIKMSKAVFLFPEIHRHTMRVEGARFKTINLHPTYESLYEEKIIRDIGYHYFSLPDTFFLEKFELAVQKIMYIAELKNIELYFSSWNNLNTILTDLADVNSHVTVVNDVYNDGRGRDRFTRPWGHFGINSHKNLAKKLISAIEDRRA